MDRAVFVEHRGTRVLRISCAGLTDVEQVARTVTEASALIRGEVPGSVRVLMDVKGVPYSLRLVRLLVDAATRNAPYVRARAVVGAPDIARAVIDEIATLARRPVRLFGDAEAALDWLVLQ